MRVQRFPVRSWPRRALSTWRTHCSPECDSDIECQRGGRSSHLAHLCPFTASPHANMSNRSLDVSLATSHLGSLITRSLGKIMKSQRSNTFDTWTFASPGLGFFHRHLWPTFARTSKELLDIRLGLLQQMVEAILQHTFRINDESTNTSAVSANGCSSL